MLESLASSIEEALDHALTPDTLPNVPSSLLDPIRYALLGGGKRIRPILCLLSSEACGGSRAAALPAALALETLHNYTLVHDDLPCMDNDFLRRGRPTVHARYGYGEAVLVGDALQALAFHFLSRLDLPAQSLRAAYTEFARAAGPAGVIGGQWLDVTLPPPSDAERIDYVHLHKTADLFIASTTLGAIIGSAHAAPETDTSAWITALSSFGRHLGIAFQIADDLLDEPERLAKPAELRELSCLEIWTEDQARSMLAHHTDLALSSLAPLPGDPTPLHSLATRLLHRTV